MRDFLEDLPTAFEPSVYRSLYVDLAHMSDEALAHHYSRHGISEGRRANRLGDRRDFVSTIPIGTKALEIGPFANPLLTGPNIAYFDVLGPKELVARAKQHNLDPQNIPARIDFISPIGDLSVIDQTFDVVISSHCVEHQPDLIRHLQGVSRLLTPGGAYYALIPDKRYCFDHFIPESNLAELLAAYVEKRTRHTLRSIIEHWTLLTHNDSHRHWRGDHGVPLADCLVRYQAALATVADADTRYIDVHAWYFTPGSILTILNTLAEMKLVDFTVHRLYPTRYGANEFWIVLRK